MPDDDSMLAQGTVDTRNEERAAANGRTTQPPSDLVVMLTERQARAVSNLLDAGPDNFLFPALVSRDPAEFLTAPEMADLRVRLLRALGEKQA